MAAVARVPGYDTDRPDLQAHAPAVLEHPVDLWSVLRTAVGLLAPGRTAIVSPPSILFGPALLGRRG